MCYNPSFDDAMKKTFLETIPLKLQMLEVRKYKTMKREYNLHCLVTLIVLRDFLLHLNRLSWIAIG